MKKPYRYMHTINGQAGHYYQGEQICYAVRTRPISLCDSLDQIRKEQHASFKWRTKHGLDTISEFGWLKVSA